MHRFQLPSDPALNYKGIDIPVHYFALPVDDVDSTIFRPIVNLVISTQLLALKYLLQSYDKDGLCVYVARLVSALLEANEPAHDFYRSPDLYCAVTHIFNKTENFSQNNAEAATFHPELLRLALLLWPFCRISTYRVGVALPFPRAATPTVVSGYSAHEFYFSSHDVQSIESSDRSFIVECLHDRRSLELEWTDGNIDLRYAPFLEAVERVHANKELEVLRPNRFREICEESDIISAPSSDVVSSLSDSLELLELVWPAARREVDYFVQGIIPLATKQENYWRSGSDANTRFVIRATVKNNSLAGTVENILHEAMHCKLYSLLAAVRLYDNDDGAVFRHPWRTDLRPLRGVLLGAHAFLAVAEFYRRLFLLDPRSYLFAKESWVKTIAQVKVALDQLAKGARFTTCGASLFAALQEGYEVCKPR